MAGKYKATQVLLPKAGKIKVYASPRVSEVLSELSGSMSLYEGVRLTQLLEAFYTQGTKDGARRAFEEANRKLLEAQRAVPHMPPGRPKKRR